VHDLLAEARASLALALEAVSADPAARVAVADAITAVGRAQAEEIGRARAGGRVRCPECGQRFRWRGELADHRWRVHGEVPS
jgi:hypothetical protein